MGTQVLGKLEQDQGPLGFLSCPLSFTGSGRAAKPGRWLGFLPSS